MFSSSGFPTVSIAIVNYNQGKYLGAAIQSVLRQTYDDFELWIWDDGSTDLSTGQKA